MKKFPLAPILLFLGGFLVSWWYQTPPSLGDDLNYWGLALDLHQGVPNAWNPGSFHDLRWPVWGVCWLLQFLVGYGALSYYLEPMLYLGAGAVLVRALARETGASERVALVAGVLFLFHPQLDSVIDRPMPDLSEGFWVATAFFAWLRLMRSERAGARIAFAAVVGLALAIGQANRITGVFAVPVLLIATLAFYPRKFGWLVACGAFAAGFVCVEAAIYHAITGDWLHSLHANLGARGRKGTEAVPFWELPFRFVPLLFRRYTDVVFNVLGLLGLVVVWRNNGRPGRALAVYALAYFLTYSCALQSFWPPRPLVRDGERFLASLAFPLAILSAFALAEVLRHLPTRAREWRPIGWLNRHFAAAIVLLVAALLLLASREHRGPNYLRELAVELRATPDGRRVLSHDAMRQIAFLAAPDAAARVRWTLRKDLLNPSPDTLAQAAACDEIWFNRKWIWTGTRKKSEYNQLDGIGAIAPWLRPPLEGWTARCAIAKGDVPDFVFLTRCEPGHTLTEQSPDGRPLRAALLPPFDVPGTWTFTRGPHDPVALPPMPLPKWIAGRTLFLSMRSSSNTTEPIRAGVFFRHGDREISGLVFKPYFFDESSEDFFFLTVPPDADSMQIRLRVSEKTKRLTIEKFRLFIDAPASQNPPQSLTSRP
jgi:hypothetical protein